MSGVDVRRLEREAAAIRWHLRLAPLDHLDPLDLAAYLGARVVVPEDFCDELLARRLRTVEWDGAALEVDGRPVVVLNSARPPTRRTATLLEELAHLLLRHAPSRIGPDPATGLLARSYDRAQEAEAYALGAALLLPRELVAAHVRRRRPAWALARELGCSEALALYRIRVTGLARRYARARSAA